ncbi:MAG: DMT family transporter [Clostridia bacterium]|nr:DMT family transporter [Clostridia bacterium]
MTAKTKGIIYMLLTGIIFSIGGVLMKLIPFTSLALNSARCFMAGSLILTYALVTKHKIRCNKHVLFSAVAIAITSALYSTAVKLTTAGAAIVIQFTAPVWAMIFCAILYKIKPRRGDIIACIAVFTGIGVCFYDGLADGRTVGNLFALASGITYAFVFMSNSGEDSDAMSSQIFGQFLAFIVGLPWLLRADFSVMDSKGWIYLLLLGFVQMGLGHLFMTKGLETTPAVTACLITGLEPILNPIWTAMFYGEPITTMFVIGAVIVLISVSLYNLWDIRQA